MRQGRGGRAALIALAATALWGQESKLSVTWDGIEVRFVTRVEPQEENARKELPGLVIITDSLHKRYFGYDLRLEPRADRNSAQLRIEPLSLSRARADEFPIGPGWTLMALPKYPVIPTLKVGETVALDLLVNPATGQKIVDYLTLKRSGFESAASVGGAHDFSLTDVELSLERPRVRVNGKLVEATANYQGGISGAVVWLYLAGHGRFVVSLFPNGKLGFQKNGVTAADTLTFREGSTEYRVQCGSAVAPGSGPYNVYVSHEAAWRPGGMNAGDSFMIGAADKAEWVVGKH
jgi:hypothetical protein